MSVHTMEFVFISNDESDTDRFGAALAHVLPPGAVIALVGTLGAGKTRLVQAVAKAVGIDPRDVVSPTFVLVHEYPRRVQGSGFRVQGLETDEGFAVRQLSAVYHFDAYRIKDDDEFRELGPEEYFESDGWTFVEWADRVADCLPSEYMRIEIEVIGPTQRRLTATAIGDRFAKPIDELRLSFPGSAWERTERQAPPAGTSREAEPSGQ
ncbi:MAG: tRNA (adenosine(37)-N6)-threonylcarbamoyltransferase complex ATPase subunit type 1 TsaE [Pirellulales bacterium]